MNWILQLLPWGIRFLAPSPLPAPNGTRYPCFSTKKSFLNWKPSTWWPLESVIEPGWPSVCTCPHRASIPYILRTKETDALGFAKWHWVCPRGLSCLWSLWALWQLFCYREFKRPRLFKYLLSISYEPGLFLGTTGWLISFWLEPGTSMITICLSVFKIRQVTSDDELGYPGSKVPSCSQLPLLLGAALIQQVSSAHLWNTPLDLKSFTILIPCNQIALKSSSCRFTLTCPASREQNNMTTLSGLLLLCLIPHTCDNIQSKSSECALVVSWWVKQTFLPLEKVHQQISDCEL